jgi:hypothetical protein
MRGLAVQAAAIARAAGRAAAFGALSAAALPVAATVAFVLAAIFGTVGLHGVLAAAYGGPQAALWIALGWALVGLLFLLISRARYAREMRARRRMSQMHDPAVPPTRAPAVDPALDPELDPALDPGLDEDIGRPLRRGGGSRRAEADMELAVLMVDAFRQASELGRAMRRRR